MYAINAVIEAIPGKEDELEIILREMVKEVQKEQDTLVYTLHKSEDNPCKFFFYELYTDMKAINHHTSTSYFLKLIDDITDIVKNKCVEVYKTLDGIDKKNDKLY